MKLLKFPHISQTYNYDCGAAVVHGILAYYGFDVYEGTIIEKCQTTTFGTDPDKMIMVLEEYGLECKEGNYSINDIKKSIDQKFPMIIDLQAWHKDEKHKSWEEEWDSGHYVVAIGYDEKNIYFADPENLYIVYLSYDDLKKRWHDVDNSGNKYINYGIILNGMKGSYDPDKYEPME